MIHDLPQDVYYEAAPTIRLTVPPRIFDFLTGALLVTGGALLGWQARGFFAIPYDWHLLLLIVPVVTFIVANRKEEL